LSPSERRISLETGAGQIIQQHLEAGIEQVSPTGHQMVEQRLLVLQQMVVAGGQLVDLDQPEIRTQQACPRA
jgi:hypothetical protein